MLWWNSFLTSHYLFCRVSFWLFHLVLRIWVSEAGFWVCRHLNTRSTQCLTLAVDTRKTTGCQLPPLQLQLLLKLPAVILFLFQIALLCFDQSFLNEMLSNFMNPCTWCSAAGWALLLVPLQRGSCLLSLEAFLSCLPHHSDVWLPDCILSSLGIEPAPLGIISGMMEFIRRRPRRADRVSSNKNGWYLTRIVSFHGDMWSQVIALCSFLAEIVAEYNAIITFMSRK